jgi:hypothetical protein
MAKIVEPLIGKVDHTGAWVTEPMHIAPRAKLIEEHRLRSRSVYVRLRDPQHLHDVQLHSPETLIKLRPYFDQLSQKDRSPEGTIVWLPPEGRSVSKRLKKELIDLSWLRTFSHDKPTALSFDNGLRALSAEPVGLGYLLEEVDPADLDVLDKKLADPDMSETDRAELEEFEATWRAMKKKKAKAEKAKRLRAEKAAAKKAKAEAEKLAKEQAEAEAELDDEEGDSE